MTADVSRPRRSLLAKSLLTRTPIGSAAMQLRWLLEAGICALGSRCNTKRTAATSPKWKVTMEPSQSELITDDYA